MGHHFYHLLQKTRVDVGKANKAISDLFSLWLYIYFYFFFMLNALKLRHIESRCFLVHTRQADVMATLA